MKPQEKFSELLGRTIDKHGLEVIRIMDRQLTEDKELFRFISETKPSYEEIAILIKQLLTKHTLDFYNLK